MKLGKLSICIIALLMVSGCHVNGHYATDIDTSRYAEAVDSRNNITRGNAKEAIALYERLYARNSKDERIAVKYAESLRKGGMPKQAIMILSPLIDVKKTKNPAVLLEYATVNIEIGYFLHAENAIDRVFALKGKNNQKFLPKAHNLLGLVLSVSGKYEKAEEHYNTALETWQGDPSPVMNNLALCLAEQGHFDRSIEMLRQASGLSTEPEMFDKNIEFVESLRSRIVPTAQ